jgi:hypothetical protein
MEAFECATWPSHGEYAGDANFLTAKDAPKHYQAAVVYEPDAIAGLTDGLERLALNMATKQASPGFFAAMFKSLEIRSPGDVEADLVKFLESDRVNERTDDDKTLVLALQMAASNDRN